MAWRNFRRSAYYSRNDSYSRSAAAESAEANGRYPRTRAAKSMGITVEAFKKLQYFANYFPSEWHHVGKYATQVTYYDPQELLERVEEKKNEIDLIYSNDNH